MFRRIGIVKSTQLHFQLFFAHRPMKFIKKTTTSFATFSFGGLSPERKAGDLLRTFFTFTACKIIMAQLQGDGRGDLGSFGGAQYNTLTRFLTEQPLGKMDSDEWLGKLMQEDELLAVRIMEVRLAYMQKDFEWDNLKKCALRETDLANIRVMRKHAVSNFTSLLQNDKDEDGGVG